MFKNNGSACIYHCIVLLLHSNKFSILKLGNCVFSFSFIIPLTNSNPYLLNKNLGAPKQQGETKKEEEDGVHYS